MATSSGKQYAFGDWRLDPAERLLVRQGEQIALTPKVFDTLALLVENAGSLVSKEDFMERVWPEAFVEDAVLTQNISQLRKVLGDPSAIETVPKKGYRFLKPVKAITDVSGEPHGKEFTPEEATSSQTRKRLIIACILLLAVSLTIGLAYLRNHDSHAPVSHAIRSLAVLPLENLSGDPEQEYFADGMTDDLITNLSQISALRVVSRTSVMQYKKTKKPLPEIARALGVDGVIEGSVIRVGDRVRINAQLLDARADSHLWAHSYERDLRDVLSMQDEVIHDIVSEIRAKVTAREQERLTTAQPVNPEAYVSYLKGCYFWNRRTEEGTRMAVENLQAAIEKDPTYAPAYTALALSYTADAIFGWLPPSQVIPKAKVAALKSLELDSRFGEAHATLGMISFQYEWDWSTAERHFEQALALSPTSVNVHFFYSLYLSALGRTVEADAAAKRQLDLDPVSPVAVYQRGLQVYRTRRFDEAINQGQASLTLDPNFPLGHWLLGEAYIGKGMYREAATEYGRYVELSRGSSRALGYLGYAHGRSGDRRKALQVLDQLRNLSRQHYVSPFYFALVYAGLGERDQAFLWLGKAFDEHCGHIVFLNVEAEWDSLREDPRFADMMRRAGIVP